MLNTLSKAPWRVVNATLAKERTGSRTSKTRLVILYMDRCGSWQDLPLLPILGNSEQVLSTATFIHVLPPPMTGSGQGKTDWLIMAHFSVILIFLSPKLIMLNQFFGGGGGYFFF